MVKREASRCGCGRRATVRGKCSYCIHGEHGAEHPCARHVGPVGHGAQYVPCGEPSVCRVSDLHWPACRRHADEAAELGAKLHVLSVLSYDDNQITDREDFGDECAVEARRERESYCP